LETDAIQIVPATLEAAREIGEHLSEADAEECRLGSGLEPVYAVTVSVKMSTEAWVVTLHGRPMVATGYTVVGDGMAAVWLLGVEDARMYRRAFLEHSRRLLATMLAKVPTLYNYVWEQNARSLRWLKWLGATFGDPVTLPSGARFVPFQIVRGVHV